jgi:transcriptional regulator with XRE-family HTH domain
MKTTSNERLRQLRLAAGKSQNDFAHDVEMSLSLLTKIEQGQRELTPKQIQTINSVYNVSPKNWLVDGKGELSFTMPVEKAKTGFDPAVDTLYKELKERIQKQDTVIDRLTQALLGGNFLQVINDTALTGND